MPRTHTRDGVELFYCDWGAGQPVVFIHSMLMSSRMWQHQMLCLAEHGYRAIAYDRRSHGRSDDPGSGYDFDTLADDLAAVVDALDLTDITLVGHSMGGGELVRYLSRHGDQRVSRVALVGATAPHLDIAPGPAAALLGQFRSGYGEWAADNADASFGDGDVSQLDREQAIRDWMGVSLRAAVECTAANMAADFAPEMREIRVPALIVHGGLDAFAPLETCGRRSADLIPDSKLVVYQNASHMLHLSHRQQLNADLLAFVQARD